MDFVVALPSSEDYFGRQCSNILVVVDRLTKRKVYIPIDSITAEDTALAFYTFVWKDYSLLSSIITDRGT